METTPSVLRKAIAEKKQSDKRTGGAVATAKIVATSKASYRAFVDAVNRAGDRDAERAQKRA